MPKGDLYNPLLDDDDLDDVFNSMTSLALPLSDGPDRGLNQSQGSSGTNVKGSVVDSQNLPGESFDPFNDLMSDDSVDDFVSEVNRKSATSKRVSSDGLTDSSSLGHVDSGDVSLPGEEVMFSDPLGSVDDVVDTVVSGNDYPVDSVAMGKDGDLSDGRTPVTTGGNGFTLNSGAALSGTSSKINSEYAVSYDDDFDDDDWGMEDSPDEILNAHIGNVSSSDDSVDSGAGSLSNEVKGIVSRHLNSGSSFDDEFGDDDDYEEEDEEDSYLAGFDVDSVLASAIEAGASDVHISPDDYISFTVNGDIHRRMEFGVITRRLTDRLSKSVVSNMSHASFIDNFELDTAYVLKTGPYKGRRTRLSVGFSFQAAFMVFRVISDVIPTPDQLGINKRVQSWASLPSGMVLICGPTGSGKSTTFASMIRKIQLERAQKIITVEKPVEYVYGTDGKALVTQREVGADAHSFASALTSAMRQAPDIIMVGEVRNREEVDELLRASETGHLAMSTMHTNSPPATVSRIMSLYEGDEQRRILTTLKSSVRGIANQTLLKKADGSGRFSIQSVLGINDEVSSMIGNGDVEGLSNYMRFHKTTMEHELVRVARQGRCTVEEARSKSSFPDYFDQVLKEHK